MKIPVDEAPTGPEMDAAVAELVGWECVYSGSEWRWRYPDDVTGRLYEKPPCYSTDIAAAWEFAPSILDGKHLSFVFNHWEIWHFDEDDPRVTREDASAETAPHAICRAFLKANGVEEIEVAE